MKTKLTLNCKGLVKLSVIICLALSSATCTTAEAQAPLSGGSMISQDQTEETPLNCMTEITGCYLENLVSVTLVMKNSHENSILLLEKSFCGKVFKVIDQKEITADQELQEELNYIFVDRHPVPGTCYYRVLQIKNEGFMYSPVATVSIENQVPISLNTEDE